jgi:HPt (histidine-containing phosphotransfer) domain-containing protein
MRQHLKLDSPPLKVQRAEELRASIAGLAEADPEARIQLGHQAHRLRGIAGTYGHQGLTDQAAVVETALRGNAQDAEVIREAEILANMVEEVGRRAVATDGDATQAIESVAADPLSAKTDGKPSASLRVLVIDDDALVRRLLGRIFDELADFQVTIVGSAREDCRSCSQASSTSCLRMR